jgi:hypothetical protein
MGKLIVTRKGTEEFEINNIVGNIIGTLGEDVLENDFLFAKDLEYAGRDGYEFDTDITGEGLSIDSIEFNGTEYLAVGHKNSPFISTYIYDENVEFWAKIENPTDLPTGEVNDVKLYISNNSLFLGAAHLTSPFFSIYKLENGI